jgi:hypothetical protein
MKIIKSLLIFSIFFLISINLCLASDSGGGDFPNPIGITSPQILIGKVIQAALGLTGSLALAMFIYGGFTWMMAAGNAEAVRKGKNILVWATIGLVVIFASYALVLFVLKNLAGQGG